MNTSKNAVFQQLLTQINRAVTIRNDRKQTFRAWWERSTTPDQERQIEHALLKELKWRKSQCGLEAHEPHSNLPPLKGSEKPQNCSEWATQFPELASTRLTFAVVPSSLPQILFSTGLQNAPPPVGMPLPEDHPYYAEDLAALEQVGDFRFGSLLRQLTVQNINIPPHPESRFDEQTFLEGLRNSISLVGDEKYRVLAAIPRLTQQQIDQLQTIFKKERIKFSQWSPKHLIVLRSLEQQKVDDWREICEAFCQKAGLIRDDGSHG